MGVSKAGPTQIPVTHILRNQKQKNDTMNEKQRINELYNRALALHSNQKTLTKLPQPYDIYCKIITDHQERSRAVLAVLTTLLLKKLVNLDQDIRLHQSVISGGFSGRGLDSRVVTPFLREKCFPYMQSDSGWLTRSLEQSHPYNLHYPGNMKPAAVNLSVDAVHFISSHLIQKPLPCGFPG